MVIHKFFSHEIDEKIQNVPLQTFQKLCFFGNNFIFYKFSMLFNNQDTNCYVFLSWWLFLSQLNKVSKLKNDLLY